MQAIAHDLDYLAARLHGRRSLLAEAERLDELCRIRTNAELARTIYPESEFHSVVAFQRQLVQDLVGELSDLLPHLGGTGGALLRWVLLRFQVENLKVLLRGIVTRTPPDLLREHLVSLPRDLTLDIEELATAQSLEEFVKLIPNGPFRESAWKAYKVFGTAQKPFFLEAALDGCYFQELLAKLRRLSIENQEVIRPMVYQEVDIFHLLLAVRGKFHYGVASELLLSLHVAGTGISRARFASMLAAPDLLTSASRAVGRVLDILPPQIKGPDEMLDPLDPAALEALAWTLFLHLANRAFRRSHMGLGAIVGYTGIRRVEVANLITVSEGIRSGIPAEVIRARLIPRTEFEPVYA